MQINEQPTQDDLPTRPVKRSAPALLRPGMVLDNRYEVVSLLGEGATSRVYAVRHVETGGRLALKVLRAGLANDAQAVERLRREARVLSALRHPGLVSVTDAGMLPSAERYVVMELLEGESLETWLSRHPVEQRGESFIRSVTSWVAQACEAVAAAHAEGVVHRDLRPANLFLSQSKAPTGQPQVRVLDFGAAFEDSPQRITSTGEILGTVAFMAPEQIRGVAPDPLMDVYALGVVLYHALTGRFPYDFDVDDIAEAMDRICSGEPVTPPSQLNTAIPQALDEVVVSALASDPEQRVQGATELAAALRRSLPEQSETTPKPRPHRMGWALLGLAAVALALVAVALWPKQQMHQPAFKALGVLPWTSNVRPVAVTGVWRVPQLTVAPGSPRDVPRSSTPETVADIPGPVPSLEPEVAQAEEQISGPKLLEQASAAFTRRDFETAETLYQQVLAAAPGLAGPANYGLGRIAFERRLYPTAAARLVTALAHEDKPNWRLLLGRAYASSGRLDDARQEWQKVAQQQSDPAARVRALDLLETSSGGGLKEER